MVLCRLLLAGLIALATSLAGAMAVAHEVVPQPVSGIAVSQAHPHVGQTERAHADAAMDASALASDDIHCCEESGEPMPGCHLLSAIVPATISDRGLGLPAQVVPPVRSTLLVGTEPSGPFDPPRTV